MNLKKYSKLNVLASFALFFSAIAANTKCMCIFHQLDKPENLKKLKKY